MIEEVAKIDLVYMLGFFMALALRRGRLDDLISGLIQILPVPTGNDEKRRNTPEDGK